MNQFPFLFKKIENWKHHKECYRKQRSDWVIIIGILCKHGIVLNKILIVMINEKNNISKPVENHISIISSKMKWIISFGGSPNSIYLLQNSIFLWTKYTHIIMAQRYHRIPCYRLRKLMPNPIFSWRYCHLVLTIGIAWTSCTIILA